MKRIVYLGTPAEAVPLLSALHEAGHEVAFVVTQPDRRRTRGGDLDPSPVKRAALELGLAVHAPARAGEVVDELRISGAELGVVVAFGQLLGPEVLECLPHGFVNVHYSLLPRWRGAAPVERAILAGDAETGVCLMQIDEGLDTGPLFASARTAVRADDTAGTLKARLTELAVELVLEQLEAIPRLRPMPQVGEPTYADKLTVEEFGLDWSRTADELERLVRAGNPRPGAWARVGGRRLKVLAAHVAEGTGGPPGRLLPDSAVATGAGVLVLDEVQPEGKRPMPGKAWAQGLREQSKMLG